MLGGEADDADTVEQREDVRWDDLVDEHDRERRPEELHALRVALRVEVQGWRSQVRVSGLSHDGRGARQTHFGRWTRSAGSAKTV